MAGKQERDPDSCIVADSIMAEVSHSTWYKPLEDDGLEELCAILKAGGIERLDFDGPQKGCQDRWTVDIGQRSMHIPCGLEVEYTDLMQAIGESTNLKFIFMHKIFLCAMMFCVYSFVKLCAKTILYQG